MKRLLVVYYLLAIPLIGYSQKDTFEVYFPFNKANLTKETSDYIDQLIFKDTLIHGNKLMIVGYADYVGGNPHNDTLSRLRAKSVKDYLATMGFDKNDITLCVGKGKINRNDSHSKDGYAADRKVEIIIERTSPVATNISGPLQQKEKADIPNTTKSKFFILDSIFFEPNGRALLPRSNHDLMKLLNFMKENPAANIRIDVRMEDCDTADEKGHYLSESRSYTIEFFLINKGIKADRMSYTAGHVISNSKKEEKKPGNHERNNPPVIIAVLTK
jgi:outer membrane protein OmpA-like peptidoglycan-associated protein